MNAGWTSSSEVGLLILALSSLALTGLGHAVTLHFSGLIEGRASLKARSARLAFWLGVLGILVSVGTAVVQFHQARRERESVEAHRRQTIELLQDLAGRTNGVTSEKLSYVTNLVEITRVLTEYLMPPVPSTGNRAVAQAIGRLRRLVESQFLELSEELARCGEERDRQREGGASNGFPPAGYGAVPPLSLFDLTIPLPASTNGPAPLMVRFSNPSIPAGLDGPLRYLWLFGDGTTSSEPSPEHMYGTPGDYRPVLMVFGRSQVGLATNLFIDVQLPTPIGLRVRQVD